MPSIPIGIIAATLPSPIKQTQPPVKQQPTVVFPPIDTKPILGGIDQMLEGMKKINDGLNPKLGPF